MRTYFLFWIQDESYKVYFRNPHFLYKLLYNLYEEKTFPLATSFYKQICQFHKVDVLSSYLKGIAYQRRKNKYLLLKSVTGERTLITVRPSILLIQSNKNIPHIFKALSYYSSHLFVCDFQNNDYFWLPFYQNK